MNLTNKQLTAIVLIFMILILFLTLGCTDAKRAKLGAIGSSGHITCYSGGKVIYEGDSTGVISTEHQSDGWYFNEKGSNQLIRVSADCVIRN